MAERRACGAQLRKRPGVFCQVNRGLYPNGRCRLHGGKTLNGMANPSFKDGAHSRYMLPLRMRDNYETALADPALLDLKPEIAAVHARIQDLIARVDSGESGHLWRLLQAAYDQLRTATDGDEQVAAIAEIGRLITRGAADYAAWSEAMKEIDRKQRLVESTRKRALELHQMISLEQLKPLLFDAIDFVRRYITDREQLTEFQRILETRFGTDTARTHASVMGDAGGAANRHG